MTLPKISVILIAVGLCAFVAFPLLGMKKKVPESSTEIEVKGDREGHVVVTDAKTGEEIRTFTMNKGVVRETHILEGGRVVAAAQKDFTVFWDVKTGKEIRRFNERIYKFSHDGKKFVTFQAKVEGNLVIYSNPDFTKQFTLKGIENWGPRLVLFSPNDRFLLVRFYSFCPLADDLYLNFAHSKYSTGLHLYDLEFGSIIKEFEEGHYDIKGSGEFSSDSKYYYMRITDPSRGIIFDGHRRFNLETNTWESY